MVNCVVVGGTALMSDDGMAPVIEPARFRAPNRGVWRGARPGVARRGHEPVAVRVPAVLVLVGRDGRRLSTTRDMAIQLNYW
jgi:hypothetical protein